MKNKRQKSGFKERPGAGGGKFPAAREYNFDGLAGPTHNYAGLPFGNLASMAHKNQASHPKAAALQGLEKMKLLMDRGFKQAVLPPHARPDLDFLKQLGLTGRPGQILQKAWEISPGLLAACSSASSMWAANSAVVSPGADTEDQKTHFTPANLLSWPHRSLEAAQTSLILKKIFSDPRYFVHHPPLPSAAAFSDEGAANHSRLCAAYGAAGAELFVYGRRGFPFSRPRADGPARGAGGSYKEGSKKQKKHGGAFISRQTREAAELIALRHRLRPERAVFAEQNPEAVSAGVFHNDVIFAADRNLVFCHEQAFTETEAVLRRLEEALRPAPLLKIIVRRGEVSLEDAVASYMFNSQLLPLSGRGGGRWLLLAPAECREIPSVRDYLSCIEGSSPIQEIQFVSLRESMRNGGGPACLRLRAVLTEEEEAAAHRGVFLDQRLYERLKAWIHRHYRDRIKPEDLRDPLLAGESQTALDELSGLLGLKGIYPFQL